MVEAFDLAAKKSLGQHFLLDLNITRKIVRLAGISANDSIMEIGPGPGGLTRALLETGADVTAIERDHRCIAALNELGSHYPNKLTLIEQDALSIDETTLDGAPFRIVANLPYNISTELLVKWLKHAALWRSMTLMFQREVADRILSAPDTKSYGRLSIIAQCASLPERGFDLPARAFTPPPKVASTVVHFEPRPIATETLENLERITRSAFSQRRKMLRTSLKPEFGDRTEQALLAVNATGLQRAAELSPAQYLKLAGSR